ncbi:MAG: aminopeptidase P family protein [Alphaproteobacteria bacterium]|nr:aminopeptidase P family protein [Alphaproteobacteria bacterium]HPF45304.1 aminopeptidase P family protein [Emcibacteraceae bacterium]HRW28508.1 aminopeptidase P family protein [Emcibacteraceae bacterium]
MEKRLRALRQELRKHKLSGFIVPHTDEHQSEYTPSYAERLAWISGFDGSAGLAAITLNQAAIFVDGRYTLQVRNQVDRTLFSIMKLHEDQTEDWFLENLEEGAVIGYDPWLHSKIWLEKARNTLAAKNITLNALSKNPIDEIWQDRPAPSNALAQVYKLRYSGEKSSLKRKRIASQIKAKGADALVITSLDSIAWLFNIRGSDVDMTPLVLSFAILYSTGSADLFIDPTKLDEDVISHLGKYVAHYPKKDFLKAVKSLGQKGLSIMIDPKRAHAAVFEALNTAKKKVIEADDPIQLDKACKNDVELEGTKKAHIRDAVAVCRFLCWLDQYAPTGKITEIDAVNELYDLRKEVSLFQGNSFATISGAGPNGAIVHYKVTENTCRKLEKDMIYLVDSGGQYLDGTTDITRTIAIGTPTEQQKDHFTRVLKGHIALAQARFPLGRTGAHLDTLARKSLWDVGLDYEHGTGHGVGSYLGVHEGPQSISPLSFNVALKPGMILSNEPGYYKTGEYGIRIENLVIVRSSDFEEDERPMLRFETITLVPIDIRLVNAHMMSAAEITWLNIYHAKVREKIAPLLEGAEKEWLINATNSITTL